MMQVLTIEEKGNVATECTQTLFRFHPAGSAVFKKLDEKQLAGLTRSKRERCAIQSAVDDPSLGPQQSSHQDHDLLFYSNLPAQQLAIALIRVF
jgi:hypothetical protein